MTNEGHEVAGSDASKVTLKRLFNETRKRLVETGTRNRLVHVNRENIRGNVLNIVNERADEVHTILSSSKAMRFKALGRDKDDGETIRLADADEDTFDAERFTDVQLETRLGPDALQKKLLKIAREAKTAEEEQGVNILYLALGFLTWFEDKVSSVPREAPLVLLPVELVRNQRTSTYDVRLREEDLLTNLPLQQRLKEDFGIRLPEIEATEDWAPSAYFDQIEAVIADRKGWKIERDAIQLGFFSFSKLLMYLDLAIEAWPNEALETHDLTRGLLYEGFAAEEPLFGAEDRLDEILSPEMLFHVVDADASQARVIEEVRAGRNLVVQGPPGTGKSQTITNIIAAAAKEGRTVLFVAEKMAALSVVHDRLVKVGLRDLCLELHSKSANKKAVLGELARTLGAAQAVPLMPEAPHALTHARDRLNALDQALHAPLGASGESCFSVLARQARYIGLGAPAPTTKTDALAAMSRAEERELTDIVQQFAVAVEDLGSADHHPFAGVRATGLQPVELTRLAGRLSDTALLVTKLRASLDAPLAALDIETARSFATVGPVNELLARLEGLPNGRNEVAQSFLSVSDLPRLIEGLREGAHWRAQRDEIAGQFVETAFETSAADMRAALVSGAGSFFARWGSAYRNASRRLAGLLREPIPKRAEERIDLVDRLSAVQASRALWRDEEAFLARCVGDDWRGERTEFATLLAIAVWSARAASASLAAAPDRLVALATDAAALDKMSRAVRETETPAREGFEESCSILDLDSMVWGEKSADGVDLFDIAARLGAMSKATDRYAEWARFFRLLDQLEVAGLGELATRIVQGDLDASAAVIELRFARAERLWNDAVAASPTLREIGTLDRHELAATFARLERSRLKENVTTILAGHLKQVPQGAMGEMRVVRGEIGKRRSHIALRRLFSTAPSALQRIKPVMLMSPISVAQYLTPGTINFDLLVIDEASQVRPEDALGAIARARQIVVVGDQKQLPPSSFFDRLLADGSESDEEEGGEDLLEGAAQLGTLESILSLCEARGLSSRMLQWHYRSRDPSLIKVSNREFYENGLILPPSPLQEDPAYGLCFTRVDGVYDKGGRRDNRKEGEAVVARVAEHARAHPDLSLGVVTFSSAQRNVITELLEFARRSDPTLDTFLREGQAEDLFVKNIENVQGDERDVILISVGYGPTIPGGRLTSMTFGPVNGDGGERRLNVLFTRARLRCEVFASFDPGDIDPSRVSRDGPRILKRFLEFAKSGSLEDPMPTGEVAETPFEEDVADVISSFGFRPDPQVGSAGFRIDLGIRHPDRPGTYILAVECDGATYHSALWARERDRLRQDVLEHLGWRFHRIWSTDWFYNRRSEIERLRVALDEARDASDMGPRIDGANQARAASVPDTPVSPVVFEIPAIVSRQMPAYARAVFNVQSWVEPHEARLDLLAPLTGRIVEAEGPIHVDEVARRVAASFGKEKAGARIVAVTKTALRVAQRGSSDLLSDGVFWFTRAQSENPPVRDRAAESGATLKAAYISMLEVRAALEIAREDNAGGEDAELVRTAARLLGFRRVGPDLQTRLTQGLSDQTRTL